MIERRPRIAIHGSLLGGLFLNGIRLVASEHMRAEPVEDWSAVRSPARAARRRRQGHPQRIVIRREPLRELIYAEGQNTMFMHPVLLAEFAAALERRTAETDSSSAVRMALEDIGLKRAADTMRRP